MATDNEVVAEIENDGYCPVCFALDDDACQMPDGTPRRDHKRRHPCHAAAALSPAHNPEDYPANEQGVIDLGHRHFVLPGARNGWLGDSGEPLPPTWWLWWHDCPTVEHEAWNWIGDRLDGNKSGHVIVAIDPFTVQGSLFCIHCGDHGFIRQNRWDSA